MDSEIIKKQIIIAQAIRMKNGHNIQNKNQSNRQNVTKQKSDYIYI